MAGPVETCPSTHVTLPNLVMLGQTVQAYIWRSTGKMAVLYQVLNKQVPVPVQKAQVQVVQVPVPNLQVQVPVLCINYRHKVT